MAITDFDEVRLIGPAGGVTFFSGAAGADLVAFTDSSQGEVLGTLTVVGIDGEHPRIVSEGPVAAFQWAPVGTRLLFLTVDAEAGALIPQVWEDGQIRRYDPVVPSAHTISQYLPFWDQYSRVLTVWSPDGETFVLAADRNGQGEILLYEVDEVVGRPLTGGRFATFAPGPVAGAD